METHEGSEGGASSTAKEELHRWSCEAKEEAFAEAAAIHGRDVLLG